MAALRVWPGPRHLQSRHKSLWGGKGRINPSKYSSPGTAFEHLGLVWGGKS